MGKASRDKGARGEREAAEKLTEVTGLPWRRSLVQTRMGGAEAPDVVCDELPGLHCEVKRGKRINLWAALEQAKRDADGKRVPFVLARKDRGKWVVLVELDDLGWLAPLGGG